MTTASNTLAVKRSVADTSTPSEQDQEDGELGGVNSHTRGFVREE